jgi:sec-independent protein translocase protein TatA
MVWTATLHVDAFMFSGGIGLPEVLLVLAIVLIIFGPKRLPALGRSLGSGMRNFKDSVSRKHDEDDEDDDGKPEITAAQAAAPADTRSEAESATGHPGEDEVVSERRV